MEQWSFTQGGNAMASLESLASSNHAQLTRTVIHDIFQRGTKQSIGCMDQSLLDEHDIQGLL